MESNYQRTTRDEAARSLNALSMDRTRLAAGIQTPWPLLAGLGAVAAWWAGAAAATSPGGSYEPSPAGGLPILAAAVVLCYLIQRKTGIRFRSMGGRAALAVAGIFAGCLALFSTSLGLVSFGLPWAVLLTSTAAFALTTWLSAVAYREAVRNLRHE